ncbi:MAG: response regulator transcription factor [Verrucomicrobia bacterium]|nr:response regulator transcription factor [Verrucomicrobiota bacterium]
MTTLLLIEDDADTRENFATLLELEGYRVVVASNGREGLAVLSSEHPDLILCDISMPHGNGFEVLQTLRSDPATASIPFVFLTARGEREDLRHGMNLGADDYLCKPVTCEELLAAIRARLTRAVSTAGRLEPGPDFSSAGPLEGLGLTPREADVMLWVAQGKSNAEVAVILGMSDKTVKIHLSHIYVKLGVETRTAAALAAVQTLCRSGGVGEGSTSSR